MPHRKRLAIAAAEMRVLTIACVLAALVAFMRGMYPTSIVWVLLGAYVFLDPGGALAHHAQRYVPRELAYAHIVFGVASLVFSRYRWGDSIGTHYVALVLGLYFIGAAIFELAAP